LTAEAGCDKTPSLDAVRRVVSIPAGVGDALLAPAL
jgi:hypothetical protein